MISVLPGNPEKLFMWRRISSQALSHTDFNIRNLGSLQTILKSPHQSMIIKIQKVKDKRESQKQQEKNKGTLIRLSADFSIETFQARRVGKKYSKW